MEKRKVLFETICTKLVFLMAFMMFGCLTFWSVKYTHEYGDLVKERVVGTLDNFTGNGMAAMLVLFVFYLLQALLLKGNKAQQRKRLQGFVIVDMIVVGIFAILWVGGCHIMPHSDQYQVYLTAVDFSKGNFQDMEGYFFMYPQQYGLAFLYECVLWIWESYHLIQYINIIFLLMILFLGYRLSEILFEQPRVSFYTVMVMNLFLPLTLYVNYVYGEMCTIAMSMWCIYAVLQWAETRKKRYGVLACLAMTLALLTRMNLIIVAIALAIGLVLYALRNKNLLACVLAVLLFIVPLGSMKLVECSYEIRSGLKVGDGIPAVAWVAMGMQQSWQGAGTYNAYNNSTFWGAGEGDSQKTADIAWEYIHARIQEFKADLPTTRYFYQSKIWEQWNVGSFSSLFMTNHFDGVPFGPAQEVYGGEVQKYLLNWMNHYLFVMYFAATVYCLYGLIRCKEIEKTLLPMMVIGGMIFSLLWEAKPRYVLPYVVIILPCVAMGIHICHSALEWMWRKVREKR